MTTALVLDASALFDLLTGRPDAPWIHKRTRDHHLVAPAHALAEMLSATGHAWRRGELSAEQAHSVLRSLHRLPVEMADLTQLIEGAWARRDRHALPDALYVELAAQLDTVVITTDRRLARATSLAVAPPEE